MEGENSNGNGKREELAVEAQEVKEKGREGQGKPEKPLVESVAATSAQKYLGLECFRYLPRG